MERVPASSGSRKVYLRVFGRICAIILVAAVAGCADSRADMPSSSDPVFVGLDRSVVEEVLSSPVAQDRVAGDAPEVARSRYQGMVRNFVLCRSALAAYQSWLREGQAPPLPEQPEPLNPASSAASIARATNTIESLLASGDIELLRNELTNTAGCGEWIPASPGDLAGPTISDVVRGGRLGKDDG